MGRVTRVAAVPVVAAGAFAGGAVGVGGLPAGAHPVPPVLGDLDGDGLVDRITLDGAADCAITVEPGLAGGGYGAPQVNPWSLVPGEPNELCPDRGAVVDLGGDGVAELVLTWFSGGPEGYPHELVVLRDFVVVAGYDGMSMPSTLATRDLDGDGLVDLYETTGQGEGFRSFLNTPSGGLVDGPLRACFDSAFWEFADFDEDGRDDLVMVHEGVCGERTQGIAVVLDDGTQVDLSEDAVWGEPSAADINGDGHQDVTVTVQATGDTIVWAGHGDGTFSPK
jgi:hypothetical protein